MIVQCSLMIHCCCCLSLSPYCRWICFLSLLSESSSIRGVQVRRIDSAEERTHLTIARIENVKGIFLYLTITRKMNKGWFLRIASFVFEKELSQIHGNLRLNESIEISWEEMIQNVGLVVFVFAVLIFEARNLPLKSHRLCNDISSATRRLATNRFHWGTKISFVERRWIDDLRFVWEAISFEVSSEGRASVWNCQVSNRSDLWDFQF